MKKKFLVIVLSMLMIVPTTILITPECFQVKAADEESSGDENNVGINTTYIHSKTQSLSEIIFYPQYYKGRSFGTSGEHHAGDLIEDWMDEIGLYDVQQEPITGTDQNPDLNATLEILSEGMSINGTESITDFFISPRWNRSYIRPLYNLNKLTSDFSESTPLPVFRKPSFSSFDDLFNDPNFLDSLLENMTAGIVHNVRTCIDWCKDYFEVEYEFTFEDYNESDPDTYPSFFNGNLSEPLRCDSYLYIDEDYSFNPDVTLPSGLDDYEPLSLPKVFYHTAKLMFQMFFWTTRCKGLILYDFNNETYDMTNCIGMARPILHINGTVGRPIYESAENDTPAAQEVSFWINQRYNDSIQSYNVIGQINGTNPNKTVLIDCLYDCWWNQGTADSAIGMATVLSLAKYFKENDITPKYTLKFVAFGGEEYGFIGAKYYSDTHLDENITMVIDLNQIGFNQTGPLPQTFFIHLNNESLEPLIECITNETHYTERTGTPYLHIGSTYYGAPSDDQPFAISCLPTEGGRSLNTICFLKDLNWTMHHRDGRNHQKGDNMTYYNETDVNVTAEMVWNITKYWTVNPDCHIHTASYTATNSSGGTAPDSITSTFTIKSVLPSDLVMVSASLYNATTDQPIPNKYQDINLVINKEGVERNITLSMPPGVKEGDYYIKLEVYNSTARINRTLGFANSSNDTDTSPTFHLNRYHTLGDIRIGTTTSSVQDIIRGSRFTVLEDALVHNITAYVYSFSVPQYRATYQCMIYRTSDGQLMGATDQKKPYMTGWCTFSFDPEPVLRNNTQYYLSIWGDNDYALVYYTTQSPGNGYYNSSYTFGTPPQEIRWEERVAPHQYSIFCRYTLDIYPPEIMNVSHTPDTVGFGGNITIRANVTDNMSGVNLVKVRIGEPGGREGNYTMTHLSGNMYRYIFTDTWLVGQYNYSIWAQDNDTNSNTSATYHFHVSANATISVATLKNNYGSDEYINLTDPPGDTGPEEFGAPTDDDDGPLFTTVSVTESNNGITVDPGDGTLWNFARGTMGYTEILTTNHTVIVSREQWELHRLHNTQWQILGEPSGVTCWQPYPSEVYINRSYTDNSGTTFIVQYLFVGGCRPKISFIGDIETTARYRIVWKAAGITTDHIEHNTDGTQVRIWDANNDGFTFNYSDVLEEFGDITQVCLQGSAENHTMAVIFDVGTLNPGVFMLDPWFGYEGNSYTGSSTIEDFIKGCTATCPNNGTADAINVALSGWNAGEKVRCVLWKETTATGEFMKIGETLERTTGGAPAWYTFTFTNPKPVLTKDKVYWLSVIADNPVLIAYKTSMTGYMTYGDDAYAYEDTLPSSFAPDTSFNDIAVLINCTFTVNNQPEVYDLFPDNGTEGVGVMPVLNCTVSDPEGDLMNITWCSNASGGWASFGVNASVVNGTYHQVFSNASTNGQWWFWKVNVTDGVYCVESPVYTFYTGCQSKIVNTGATDIKGYLLIQVQYNNSGTWIVDNDTVDETTTRTIGVGGQLALDTIFNGLVKTSDLTHGYGSYRVYAAFRDADGDVLVSDDETVLEATWEFAYTSS